MLHTAARLLHWCHWLLLFIAIGLVLAQCDHTIMAVLHCLTSLHWRTPIRTGTRIPNTAIGDRDPSLGLCNVNFQHTTIEAKGKTLKIQVWICRRAILHGLGYRFGLRRITLQGHITLKGLQFYSVEISHCLVIPIPNYTVHYRNWIGTGIGM